MILEIKVSNGIKEFKWVSDRMKNLRLSSVHD